MPLWITGASNLLGHVPVGSLLGRDSIQDNEEIVQSPVYPPPLRISHFRSLLFHCPRMTSPPAAHPERTTPAGAHPGTSAQSSSASLAASRCARPSALRSPTESAAPGE